MPHRDDKGKAQAEDESKDWGEIDGDSLVFKNAVDTLWVNVLALYFRAENNYMIAAIPDMKSKEDSEFTNRCIDTIELRNVIILIENKRVSDENSDAVWSEAMDLLSDCMHPPLNSPMYGIVTVGHYSRYYTLYPEQTTLSDFRSRYIPEYNGQRLHFKDDEHWMHMLLEELVELTS
ncbi:hypothetical protein IL306_012989 [Fusarium sp. DS 682]|nr:hypothetical protein IL306_012989 [Fusarium sp. DS 682]